MADLQRTVSIIFEGDTSKATAAVSSLEKSLSGIGAEAGTASPKLDDMSRSAENLGKSSTSILSLSNALKLLGTGAIVKEFIDANVAAETFDKSMVLLKGSTAAAAAEFDYIKGLSNTLGLNLRSTADAYVQLTAATRGTALEGDNTRLIFEAVSKAMSSLGKSSADTQGALLAISQIVSKGNVSMEELRGQLGERLPGAFAIAAKSMGLTTAELDKLVSSGKVTAEEFLPNFARELQNTFGKTDYVDTYTAAINRLSNQLDATAITLGKAGTFDLLTSTLNAGGVTVGAYAGGLQVLIERTQAFYTLLQTGNFEAFNRELTQIAVRAEAAGLALSGELNENLAETARLSRQAADAAAANADQSDAETQRLLRYSTEATKAIGAVDASLKALGVDPKKLTQPIIDLGAEFEKLAQNPAAQGNFILAGLEGALKKATENDLQQFKDTLVDAFEAGRISADELNKGLNGILEAEAKIDAKSDGTAAAIKKVADETKKAADEARKAEENAAKMALELEKLASNERIKYMEFQVQLDIAQLEADTERVIRAFDSIDNTVSTTGEALGELFGLLAGFDDLNFEARDILRDQLDIQNQRQQDALNLQKQLVEAQIANIRAQTQALEKGDSLIQIDGAGLQPHLEAFMWEILRTIQVRVNQDGLAMLLGTP